MISLIIPVFNEEKSINNTIICYKQVIESLNTPYEIIVVDDGSTDNTVDNIITENILIIKHPNNLGYGQALKSGIKKANYDLIIITDGDESYPPYILKQMIKQYTDHQYDMIVANRVNIKHNDKLLKNIFRKILKKLVEFTTGKSVPDINSGLRIFSKSTIDQFIPHLCNTFSFTTSLTLAYMMNSKHILYIPIKYMKRSGTSKVKIIRDSLRTLQYIIEAILFFNPIKLFLIISLINFMIAFFLISLSFYFNNLLLIIISSTFIILSGLSLLIGFISIQLKQINIDNKFFISK